MEPTIDLSELTRGGEVHNLSGHERGLAARNLFELDRLDGEGRPVDVLIPSDIYTVTPSFFQGMFSQSVLALGGDGGQFLSRFRFRASPVVMRQIQRGIDSVRMKRDDVLMA
jgi:hypothetical protein